MRDATGGVAVRNDEPMLVTADEFVTDLLCSLALHSIERITLADTMADGRFQGAFTELLEARDALGVDVDFSLAVNPYHGDSSTLRETLYDLRERGIVSINNPSFKTVQINVDSDDAEHFLRRSSLPRDFIEGVVSRHFVEGAAFGAGDGRERAA